MTYDELITAFQASAEKHGYMFSASSNGWTVFKPKAIKEPEMPIENLVIDRYRASSDVTQHAKAVRVVHVPTGIVVNCAEHRSYKQNLDAAMNIMRARLKG